jgi:hypothetical protein
MHENLHSKNEHPTLAVAEVSIHSPVLQLLSVHCKQLWIYVFPEKELRGLSPKIHIHVSVSDSHDRSTYFTAAE